MNALIRWLQELPDAYCLCVFLLITVVFLVLPWAVARWRDRLWKLHQVKPQRKRRCAIWLAALGALVPFPVLFVFVGIVIWSVVLALPKPSFTEADDKVWLFRVFKGVDDDGLARICIVFGLAVVSFLTGVVYRALRWEKVDAPRDGEGGHAITAADAKQLPSEDGR